MAVASMVRRVRFRNKVCAVIVLFLIACGPREDMLIVNAGEASLTTVNGVVFRNGERFTGKIYTMFPLTSDTVEISSYYRGVEDGTWIKKYQNGRIMEIRHFADGKKTGIMNGWWENGYRKLEYHFDEDEYEGRCREWNPRGILVREMHYTQGHENGSQKVFYDNGKIRSNYVVVNGRRYGLLGTKNCVNATDRVFKN